LLIPLSPESANHTELAFYRARGPAESAGYLFGAESFHFPKCDGTEFDTSQAFESPPTFFGDHGREFGRGLSSRELFKTGLLACRSGEANQRCFVKYNSAAALLAALATPETDCLAFREGNQNAPQIVAILQLRELAARRSTAKAVKCAKRHIFLIGCSPRKSEQLLMG
jgi:hypothetical protein